MPGVRQTSFAAGELSPLLWGRTDLGLYRHGLRHLRDFFVTRQGMAVSRPGTQHLGGAYANMPSRLVPFLVSDEDAYVLEFSSGGSMQAWRNGAKVGSAVVMPWSFTPVYDLQFAQSGDVLIICAKYDVYQLRRTGSTTFVFSAYSFTRTPGEWVTIPAGTPTTGPLIVASTLLAATATSPAKPWRWWVSCLMRDSAGRLVESEPLEAGYVVTGTTLSAYGGSAAVGPDRPVTLTRQTVGPVWSGTRSHEVLGFNWYRGVGELSGFVGHSTTGDFVDDGREPDYALPRPRSADPFVYNLPGSAPTQDYPLTVGFFEDRLVFGGTFQRPNGVLASASGDYIDFNTPVVPIDNSALELELIVRKREKVRGLASKQRLIVLTDANAWVLGTGAALTPLTIGARVISEVGSARIFPLEVGDHVLYVRAKGHGLRAIRPSENAEGLFGTLDLSWSAEHLFHGLNMSGIIDWWRTGGLLRGDEVVDWAYQEDPWNLVWLVRADGKLISMQWDGRETPGFSMHATGTTWGDRFESVCSVPEGNEDVVYVCVSRSGQYLIERFTSRMRRQDVNDDCCLDCATQKTVTTGSPTITGLPAALEGREVWVVAKDNAPIGPMTVTVGSINLATAGFRLPTANDGSNVTCWVGLRYQPELELLDVVSAESRMKQRTVVKVAVEVSDSKGLAVGQTFNDLTPWVQRRPSDAFGVPSAASEVVELPVQGHWDNGGRAVLRQTLPLPLTVLGVTRELDFGG